MRFKVKFVLLAESELKEIVVKALLAYADDFGGFLQTYFIPVLAWHAMDVTPAFHTFNNLPNGTFFIPLLARIV